MERRWRMALSMPLRACIAATAALLFLVLAAAASAQDPIAPPTITSKPTITGTPQVGATLAASVAWTGDPASTVSWAWQRCVDAGATCKKITGAVSDRYVVTAADVGAQLRVRVIVSSTTLGTHDEARSAPTAVVTAPPSPAPPPSSQPPPSPGATPSGSSGAPATPAALPTATALTMLRPFPVVRLRGSLTSTGARIAVFTVRVPARVKVVVGCRGSGCPVRRLARRATTRRTIRFRRFEQSLPAGTRLTVKVTRAGRIGKWSTILIRRGAAPRRSDLCAYPGARAPAPCPR
jgi:hypothetical protein